MIYLSIFIFYKKLNYTYIERNSMKQHYITKLMDSEISGTFITGKKIINGVYDVTNFMGTMSGICFPYKCPRQFFVKTYITRIYYILKASFDKLSKCDKLMDFSVCEECFKKFPISLKNKFFPVFVNESYPHPISCDSDNFIDSFGNIKFAIINDFIINVEYSSNSSWKFADVEVDSTTITVKIPIAECEFRMNFFTGMYSSSNERYTYSLNSITKDCAVLESLFKKNIYYRSKNNNKMTIKQTHFDKTTNTAKALKFTALNDKVIESTTTLTSVEEITKQGQNRLQLCIHTANEEPSRTIPSSTTHFGPSATHFGVYCDGCEMAPIVGTRYYCKKCNFDLCSSCLFRSVPHDHTLYSTDSQLYNGIRIPQSQYLTAPRSLPIRYTDSRKDSFTNSSNGNLGIELHSASSKSLRGKPTHITPAQPAPYTDKSKETCEELSLDTDVLLSGAVTKGTTHRNVTTTTIWVADHKDILSAYIQIFCTNSDSLNKVSEKYLEMTIPELAPVWKD